jgi:hypothetical protein
VAERPWKKISEHVPKSSSSRHAEVSRGPNNPKLPQQLHGLYSLALKDRRTWRPLDEDGSFLSPKDTFSFQTRRSVGNMAREGRKQVLMTDVQEAWRMLQR